jgi:hypothetical protein
MKHISVLLLLTSLLFVACIPSADIEGLVKSLPAVQDFLKSNPEADIRIVSWDEATLAANQNIVQEACNQKLPPKRYYYVTVMDEDTSLQMFLDRETNDAVCIFRKGAESEEDEAEETGLIKKSKQELDNEEDESDNDDNQFEEIEDGSESRPVSTSGNDRDDDSDDIVDDEPDEDRAVEIPFPFTQAETPEQDEDIPSTLGPDDYTIITKSVNSAEIECQNCEVVQCTDACTSEIERCLPPKLLGTGGLRVGSRTTCECSCVDLG